MTLDERMARLTTVELKGLLNQLQLTINYSPVLSDEQLRDLSDSYQKVLAEISYREQGAR